MESSSAISETDFVRACQDLAQCLKDCAVDYKFIQQDGHNCLIFRRSVTDQKPNKERSHYADPDDEVVTDVEADPARLDVLPLNPWNVPIEYHILLSPTYRVPVLYFQALYPLDDTRANGIDLVLEHLVPASSREQVESVGVMGAISMTDHPISGLIFFFVHPCNTADALREIIGTREISPLEYMLLWLGLVGPTVGLQMPKDIAFD